MAVPDYFAVVAMIGWQTGGKPPLGPGDCNPLAQRIIYGRRTAAAHRQLTLTITSNPLGTRTTGISLARRLFVARLDGRGGLPRQGSSTKLRGGGSAGATQDRVGGVSEIRFAAPASLCVAAQETAR
jgi:hypothetical protein